MKAEAALIMAAPPAGIVTHRHCIHIPVSPVTTAIILMTMEGVKVAGMIRL
jgi:hypothetical protein